MKPCNRCGDFGILAAKVVGENQETLVYCICDWANPKKLMSARVWALPVLNRKIEDAFHITKCPLAWFKPNVNNAEMRKGRLISAIGPIVELWKIRVRHAEKFWEEYLPIFENDKEPA